MLKGFGGPRIAAKDNMSITACASSASRYPVPFLSDLRLFSSCCCSVDIFVNSIIVNMSPMAINMKIAIA
jgi:hypothetical protein